MLVSKFSIVGLLIMVIGALFAVAGPSLVSAHGGGVEFNKKEFAGPYEVALGIVPDPPALGETEITLAVIDLDTRTAVIGANVIVTARGPNSTVIGPLTAEPDPADPAFYDLRTTLNKEGIWIFTVEVSAPAGEGSADFIIEIEKSSSITRIITLLTLLAFVVILGLAMRAFLRERREPVRGRRVKRKSS